MRNSILTALICGLMATVAPAYAQDEPEYEDSPPPMRDPAQSLPSRADGQSVLSGREAFDRGPQFQLGRRERRTEAAPEDAYAQLTGQAQTLSYECDIGERLELVGADNIVTVTGQCLALSIVGNGNQVDIEVVDDVRIQGDSNDIRWGRGFTMARPEVMQLEGSNTARKR